MRRPRRTRSTSPPRASGFAGSSPRHRGHARRSCQPCEDAVAISCPVAQGHDAGAKGLALHQTQGRDPGRVREQPLAAAQHDRIGEQPLLVDEPGGGELPYHPDAARRHDVPARLRFQCADLVDAPQHGRVLLRRVLERAGDDVLYRVKPASSGQVQRGTSRRGCNSLSFVALEFCIATRVPNSRCSRTAARNGSSSGISAASSAAR